MEKMQQTYKPERASAYTQPKKQSKIGSSFTTSKIYTYLTALILVLDMDN